MQDGFNSLISGQHASLATSLLQKSAYHKGVNTALRNGHVQTRPPWRKLAIDLPEGAFKGALFTDRGDDYRLCMVLGRTGHLFDLDALKLVETIPETFAKETDRVYMCAAEHAIIIQNGKERAIVHLTNDEYDDEGELVRTTTESKRMNEDDGELPVGTYMIYVHGRIFVVTGDKKFKAGDIFVDTDPEKFLKFTETDYLNGGGAFGLPAEFGKITGLATTTNVGKNSTGALQVHTERGVAAFNVHAARYLWGEIDISGILYNGPGSVSDRSFVNSNADLFFRSSDGLRSFGFTVSNERNPNGFAFRDVSREVKPSLDMDTKESIKLASMAKADERLFCTVVPDGGKFKALIALDIAPATTLTAPASPAWDGIWTGLDIHQVLEVTIDGKAAVLAVADVEGETGLYVLDDDELLDNGTTPIKSRIYTRAYNFDSRNVKQLQSVDVTVEKIETTSTLKVYYRPAGYPLWAELDTHEIKIPEGGLAQPRSDIRFSTEAMKVPFNPVTEAKLSSAKSFEFCLEWTGRLQVAEFVAVAEQGEEEFTTAKVEDTVQNIQAGQHGVEIDDYDYEVTK